MRPVDCPNGLARRWVPLSKRLGEAMAFQLCNGKALLLSIALLSVSLASRAHAQHVAGYETEAFKPPCIDIDKYVTNPIAVSRDYNRISEKLELLRNRMEVLNRDSGYFDPQGRVNAIQTLEYYGQQLVHAQAILAAYRGLHDARNLDVRWLQVALSELSGSNIVVIPYEGGLFGLEMDGLQVTTAPISYDELTNLVRETAMAEDLACMD